MSNIPIYLHADSIVSPLGFSTEAHIAQIMGGHSGLCEQPAGDLSPGGIWAARLDSAQLAAEYEAQIGQVPSESNLEKMLRLALYDVWNRSDLPLESAETVFVLATTKGEIDRIAGGGEYALPTELLRRVQRSFGNYESPIVVCQACVSGMVAMEVGARLLRRGRYRHAVILGGDILSEFVVSGFEAFKALSPEPCRPYDSRRRGINLGEGAAALLLSRDAPRQEEYIVLEGMGTSNDANHISGPSRDGEGLYLAIRAALGGLAAADIDFLSLHGTATLYNDDMESRALALAGLGGLPAHSLKGYFGHTLGAAGLIESIVAAEALRRNLLLASSGFEQPGTAEPMNIIQKHRRQPLRRCLKTASGFGGCNAALLFGKTYRPENPGGSRRQTQEPHGL